MPKKRIGILFGGKSVEHEVSIQSARNVFEAIDKAKFEVVLIGIDKAGRWQIRDASGLLESKSPRAELEAFIPGEALALVPGGGGHRGGAGGLLPSLDAVIPLLHGTYGEDGSVQGLLKLADVPFVGAGVLGSAIGMDKDVAKRLLRDAGIPVARFQAMGVEVATAATFESIASQLGRPFFVKPSNSGSSVGVSKVDTAEGWAAARSEALRYDRKLLVEEFIAGQEVEVAVLGNGQPRASVVGEIVPGHDFYSYEAKYLDEKGAVLRIPAALSPGIATRVQALAIQAFRVLECAGMARVDFFVTTAGQIYVNEINTLPGFTKVSMYPKLWEASGIAYGALIETLVDLAIDRHRDDQAIETCFQPTLPA
jgi:D-alanine-D-alanine ligase